MVPSNLTIQQFDGAAWIGVVPFHMEGVMRRPLPDLPWVSAFPELNVRTYVERDGKAGVWFFSLDASNSLAVWAARRFFHLPYFHASMQVVAQGHGIDYRSRRKTGNAAFEGSYEPVSQPYASTPGTLEHWLTERYCLYHIDHRGAPYRLDIHHPPWSLQPAEVMLSCNRMAEINDLRPLGQPPLLHFCKRQDMIAWPPAALAHKDR